MKIVVLENRILESIYSIMLDEDLDDLKNGEEIDRHFLAELSELKVYNKYFITTSLLKNKLKAAIKFFKELESIKTQEELDTLREKMKIEKEFIAPQYEKLTFSVYEFAKENLAEINKKNNEDLIELEFICDNIHPTLRNVCFYKVADTIADLKIAAKEKLGRYK